MHVNRKRPSVAFITTTANDHDYYQTRATSLSDGATQDNSKQAKTIIKFSGESIKKNKQRLPSSHVCVRHDYNDLTRVSKYSSVRSRVSSLRYRNRSSRNIDSVVSFLSELCSEQPPVVCFMDKQLKIVPQLTSTKLGYRLAEN
jgi:hypothetical protein